MKAGNWKKVSSNETHSLFKSPEGHEIKVAHSALTPNLKKQLYEIPHFDDGGFIKKAEGFLNPGGASTDDPYSYHPPKDPRTDVDNTLAVAPLPKPAAAPPGAPADSAADTATPAPTDMNSTFASQLAGLKEQSAGAQAEAGAVGELGTQQAEQERTYQDTQNDAFNKYTAANDALTKERLDLQGDIMNRHVNPHQYIDNMSTGKSIRTGIGLILGGMGSGLTHGPNLAFQFLQNQIDRDIDSQKVELGKKQNLLSNNLAQTGNLRAATELTRLHNNDILSSALKEQADMAQDPIQKARMLQMKGMFDGQSAQLQTRIAQMQALSGGNSNIPLEWLPKDQRERAVQLPGGGVRLATTAKGAEEVREQLQTVTPIFQQLDNLAALGPAALVPGSPAAQKAEAIRSELIPMVNENAGLKRLSGEDIGNIKNMITDPSKFSTLLGGQAKSATLKNFLQDKLTATMSQQLEGGAPRSAPQKKADDPAKYLDWARKNSDNPKAKFILSHYGNK